MVRLLDFLPADHPLRSGVKFAEPLQPMNLRKVPNPKKWNPLFVTTTMFLSKSRTRVTQEFAGDNPLEVLQFLSKRGFKPGEVEELTRGFPVDSKDGKEQYHLDPLLPKNRLGDIRVKTTSKEATMPDVKPVMTTGWGPKLKKLREGAGLTQVKMSELLGATYNVMSSMENEKRKLSASERALFYQAIGKAEDHCIPIANEVEIAHRIAAQGREPQKKPVEMVVEKSVEAPVSKGNGVEKSPIRSAAMQEIEGTLMNPKLSDAQIGQLMNLFKSLTVTVLLS